MGDYRIKIEATGGHGCGREIGDGGIVKRCGDPHCPDCLTVELVDRLKKTGNIIRSATLTHWPETPSQVVDDLLTGKRQGHF